MNRTFNILLSLTISSTVVSCGERPAAPPATQSVAASRPADSPRRIALLAVPLTADVPHGWDVRNGPAGRPLLNGPAPSGEVNIRLTTRPPVRADGVAALIDRLAVVPGSPRTLQVTDRDGMKVIEQFERLGPAGTPADKLPVRWSIQYVLLGEGLEYPIYELDVADYTLLDFERDAAALRPIFDSVQADASVPRDP